MKTLLRLGWASERVLGWTCWVFLVVVVVEWQIRRGGGIVALHVLWVSPVQGSQT